MEILLFLKKTFLNKAFNIIGICFMKGQSKMFSTFKPEVFQMVFIVKTITYKMHRTTTVDVHK